MNPEIISFSIKAHQDTNDLYDGKPYSVHLSMVFAYCLKYIHLVPVSYHSAVMDGCWLHDVIENCRLTYNDVKKVAGLEVAEIAYACTNDKGRTRSERAGDKYYKGFADAPFSDFVKLCDRLANVFYSKSKG